MLSQLPIFHFPFNLRNSIHQRSCARDVYCLVNEATNTNMRASWGRAMGGSRSQMGGILVGWDNQWLFMKGRAWDLEHEREMKCGQGRVFSLEEKYVYRCRWGRICDVWGGKETGSPGALTFAGWKSRYSVQRHHLAISRAQRTCFVERVAHVARCPSLLPP